MSVASRLSWEQEHSPLLASYRAMLGSCRELVPKCETAVCGLAPDVASLAENAAASYDQTKRDLNCLVPPMSNLPAAGLPVR